MTRDTLRGGSAKSGGTSFIQYVLRLYYDLRTWLLQQRWFTSSVLPLMPRRLRWALRKLYFLPADVLERRAGLRDELVPPKSVNFTGGVTNYTTSGDTHVSQLEALGCLHRESTVLDVGCGMGRLAVALQRSGKWEGSYEGLDIVPTGIEWCTKEITSKHPSLRFTLSDVYNGEYNPAGKLRASEYRFPYDDGTFDLAVLISVFTHMLPDDMNHYVSEVSRVLATGGCCFATFTLLDEESLRTMADGQSMYRFTRIGPHWTVDLKVPELAIAYESTFVQDLFERHGLSPTIHHGSWSGRSLDPDRAYVDDQDGVVSVKK